MPTSPSSRAAWHTSPSSPNHYRTERGPAFSGAALFSNPWHALDSGFLVATTLVMAHEEVVLVVREVRVGALDHFHARKAARAAHRGAGASIELASAYGARWADDLLDEAWGAKAVKGLRYPLLKNLKDLQRNPPIPLKMPDFPRFQGVNPPSGGDHLCGAAGQRNRFPVWFSPDGRTAP